MDNQKFYSSRLLHHELKVGTQYTKWFDRVIERINEKNSEYSKNSKLYTLNIDYFKIESLRHTKNPKNPHSKQDDYIITQQLYDAIKNIQRPELQ